MRQELFRSRAEPRWRRIEEIIDGLERGKRAGTDAFPELYRQLCRDLAVARDRGFDISLVDRLNRLALRGHQHLYRFRRFSLTGASRFLRVEFPSAVRREWRTILFAALLFFGGLSLIGLLVQSRPELVYSVLAPEQVRELEAVYDPASERFLKPVDQGEQFGMFGYYLFNNIGISFRIFAGGILFGVGSFLVVLYNGLYLGAVAGHLFRIGFGRTLLGFVASHSALELLAITLAGVSGLRLGWSLVAPGRLPRAESLRRTAARMLPLLYGSTVMLVLAALVEAFWSPLGLPPAAKYAFGAAWWLLLPVYFTLSGRGRGRRHGV